MDQLIIILKKMIEINNERVVDFYHIIGVIVFEKLHIDHQKEDYKHSLTIAKILAKISADEPKWQAEIARIKAMM